MKVFEFLDYLDEDENKSAFKRMTEREIFEEYYPYWLGRMEEAGKDEWDMTFENCLEDWKVVNWAIEVDNV